MAGASQNGACPRCLLSFGVSDGLRGASEGPDLAWLLEAPRPPDAVKFFSFGDYELLEEIARGGMGIVFRARQKSLGRIVALKFIRREGLASPEAVQRFRIEAETAANLSHPNIVPIYEFAERDGQPYISMKLMQESLAQWLVRKSAGEVWVGMKHGNWVLNFQAIREVTDLIAKVARALDYAHERGIFHRDIKPGNILIDEHGEPCLSDFGLAKLSAENTREMPGTVLGTPAYISPEQAAGMVRTTGRAADVYGLGATLYELLTGQAPFVGKTPHEILIKVAHQEPEAPQLKNGAIPPDLAQICTRCLAKSPVLRYASAADLAAALAAFLYFPPTHRGKPR